MTEQTHHCLERAAYCTRLAESDADTELKAYLLKLAVSWTRASQKTLQEDLEDA
jgi:hypothetical protein